ncbi:hypothetical protein [Veronia pacifica]|uniref:Uncharacterized protein n=1 Tax=Veronia pacifica TaxID=1080227 RepID=A0A1C3E522_9GAMM|nr:hypothetical protein [Veronia pacifica]ODA28351.1 hypothetical protein A8L45_23075 [Veronia pacifica]
MTKALNLVNKHLSFPEVTLISPSESKFIHIAADVDSGLPFLPNSKVKNQLISDVKSACDKFLEMQGVVGAHVFSAILIPPGRGNFIKQREDKVHIANFDLVVLIECESELVEETLRSSSEFMKMISNIDTRSKYTHEVSASNARRIGPVDHSKQGVFLFNYFFADDVEQNLGVWNYTAGWFEAETQLDNSTLLLPREKSESKYTVINHCRWDSLREILPSLIFKSTFRKYVLDNFEANNVAAMPILYKLA